MKRVAITGPESTGKSHLSKELASVFGTVYVKEMAREYIAGLEGNYQETDIVKIAQAQLHEEERLSSYAKDFLFCDTELIVTKIWSLHKYEKCHPWILAQIEKNPYDLYLLCDIDLPWKFDPQREHPHLREYFLQWYIKELENYHFPYYIVKGQGSNRVDDAVKKIQSYFKTNAHE